MRLFVNRLWPNLHVPGRRLAELDQLLESGFSQAIPIVGRHQLHFSLDAVEPLVQLGPVDFPQGANGLPDIFNFLLVLRHVRQDCGFALLRAHRVPVPAGLGFGSVLRLFQGPGAGDHRVVDRHVIAWPIQRQAVATPIEDAPTDRGKVGGEVEPFFSFGQTL